MTGPAVPTWFTRRPTDHRAACLQLPAATEWFATPSGVGGWLDDVVWLQVGDRIVALGLAGPIEVLPCGGDALLLRGADGSALVLRDEALAHWPPGPYRRGADLQAVRTGAHWSCDAVPLPDGAMRARRLEVAPAGRIVCWADGGWVYRLRDDRIEALGPIAGQERLAAGPAGAALVGSAEAWERVVPPRGPMVRLAEPLASPVRWSVDGWTLSAASATEEGVVLRADARTGQVEVMSTHGVPLTHTTCVDLREDHPVVTALSATPAGERRQRLVGPGGLSWDLATGTPDGSAPRSLPSLPGDVLPCPAPWAALGLEHVVRRHGRLWAFSDDGHLVAFPDDGQVIRR